jgi:phage antirepressor YoqD-like protein
MDKLSTDGKRMTIKEVAGVLGVSVDTVYNSAKALFPEVFKKGKATYLNEVQVTEVKMNLRKNSEVAAMPKTDLEKKLIVAQAMQILQEEIAVLKAQNKVMLPKANYYDALVDSNTLTSIRDTCKELKVKERQFIQYLIERKYIYRENGEGIKPYADRMDFFAMKDFVSDKGFVGSYTLVTVKGKEHFRKRIKEIECLVLVPEKEAKA